MTSDEYYKMQLRADWVSSTCAEYGLHGNECRTSIEIWNSQIKAQRLSDISKTVFGASMFMSLLPFILLVVAGWVIKYKFLKKAINSGHP